MRVELVLVLDLPGHEDAVVPDYVGTRDGRVHCRSEELQPCDDSSRVLNRDFDIYQIPIEPRLSCYIDQLQRELLGQELLLTHRQLIRLYNKRAQTQHIVRPAKLTPHLGWDGDGVVGKVVEYCSLA